MLLYEGVDHIVLPVADLEGASAAFERLGLRLTPAARHAEMGTANRVFFAGSETNLFYVELIGIANAAEAAAHPRGAQIAAAIAAGRGLLTVMLRVSNMQAAVAELAGKGVTATLRTVRRADGSTIGEVADLDIRAEASFDLSLIQYAEPQQERYARYSERGLLTNILPLKRLDHLAAVAPDIEGCMRFWIDVLGVPLAGEVRTPVMIIRQLRVGDVMLELLGPATPDSPIAKRPAGPASMAAFEVPDLAAAVAQVRASGFTAPDPAPGALPNTHTATVAATELAGLGLQLLQYDRPNA
ncbi:MAG: VOC family protein [Dehalococcoidia bacterium]